MEKQEKSYLHVSECVDGILFAIEKSKEDINIFNIGSEDTMSATKDRRDNRGGDEAF